MACASLIPSLNPVASRSRCADLVDRSALTSKDAQKAGRGRLPGRVPFTPFPINGENVGFVHRVRRISIERRDP